MASLSYTITDDLHRCAIQQKQIEQYDAGFNLETVEDLVDGMLKGKDLPGQISALKYIAGVCRDQAALGEVGYPIALAVIEKHLKIVS